MNLEDELIRQRILVETGQPFYIKGDRLEMEDEDVGSSMPMPEPGAVTPGAPTDGFKPMQLPASPFPGQPSASVALGVPGEAGAAAPIQPTDFSGIGSMARDITSGVAINPDMLVEGLSQFARQTGNLAMAIGPAAVNKALQEAVNFGAELIDAIGNKIGKDPQALNAVRNFIPQIEVEGGVAKFTKDISSFVWSFALLKRLGAGNISSGAVADALQNPEEGNLSTVAVEMGFGNELFDYLNSKVGRDASAEKRLEARLKNSFEGAGISAAVGGIMLGIKVLKRGGGKAVEMIQKQLSEAKLQQTSNSGIDTAKPAGM